MTVDTLAKPQDAATAALIATAFSHIAQGDTEYKSGGLRDFFLYRDLGIAEATGGQVIAQLVKANLPPEEGTGWHYHEAKFHIVRRRPGNSERILASSADSRLYS